MAMTSDINRVAAIVPEELLQALADLTQDREEVTAWLQEPNEAFDGSSPLQVIERGESDRIWRMIYYLRSGEPS
jgi:uncharacterized protein (DUF2384 family)